jgi:hypothetical protein
VHRSSSVARRRVFAVLALFAAVACRRGAREPDAGPPEAAVPPANAMPSPPLVVQGEAVDPPVATVTGCAGACTVTRLRERPAVDGAGGVGTRLFAGDTLDSPADGEAELRTVDARITLRMATRVSLGRWAPEELLLHQGALDASSLPGRRVHLDLCTAAGMIRFRGESLAASVTAEGRAIVRSSPEPSGDWQSLELLDGLSVTRLPFGESVRIALDGVLPPTAGESDADEADTAGADASVPERLHARLAALLADVETQRARLRELLARTGGGVGQGAADVSPVALEAELTAAASRSAGADRMLAAAWYRLELLDPAGDYSSARVRATASTSIWEVLGDSM